MTSPRTERPPVVDAVRARRLARTMVVDVACVLGFVAVGRRTHDEAGALAGLADTAAPFLVALLVGWAAVLLTRLEPTSVPAGAVVVATTVVLGMLWRHTVAGDGTPATFVAVATTFLTVFLLGWRVVVALVRRVAAGA